MPRMTYDVGEVAWVARVAYATGVRDALISLQGHPLDEAQATALREMVEGGGLSETVETVIQVAVALAAAQTPYAPAGWLWPKRHHKRVTEKHP